MSQTKAPSRIRLYRPGRLIVAWAVLGSAAAVGLMYSPVVYEEQARHVSGVWQLQSVEKPPNWAMSSGRVRVLRTVVYDEAAQMPQDVGRAILWWRQRVIATLLLLGGLVGALVGWREQRRSQRRPLPAQRGGRLWLAASLIMFAILSVAGFPGDSTLSLSYWIRTEWSLNTRFGPRWPAKELFEYEFDEFVRVTIAAIVIGWAAHVAARARGVRWPSGRRPDQAADYGEDVVGGEVGDRVGRGVDPTPSGSKGDCG